VWLTITASENATPFPSRLSTTTLSIDKTQKAGYVWS
jgi:hypothetical protein